MTLEKYQEFKSDYLVYFNSFNNALAYYNTYDYQNFKSIDELISYLNDTYFQIKDLGDVWIRTDGKPMTKELIADIMIHEGYIKVDIWDF